MKLLSKAIAEQIFPGCVVGILENDREQITSLGNLTYKKNSSPTTKKTIYDVASITKSVVTGSLLVDLIDKAIIDPQLEVAEILPEFKPQNSTQQKIRIKDLLEYKIDFDLKLSEFKNLSAQQIKYKVLTASIKKFPLSEPMFINATSLVLGWLIEAATGEKLDHLAYKRFFKSLEMNDTFYGLQQLKKLSQKKNWLRVAPSEVDHWRDKEIKGEIHDESAWQFMQDGEAVGSAGLFTTVSDLLKFIKFILKTPHLNRGLGWEQNTEWMGIDNFPDDTFIYGKTGFTGCCLVVIPNQEKALVLLSNHTYPQRQPDKTSINNLRRQLITNFAFDKNLN